MAIVWLIFVRFIAVMLMPVCKKLGIDTGGVDEAATWIAGIVVTGITVVVQIYMPKLYAAWKNRGGNAAGLLMVLALGGVAGVVCLPGCASWFTPTVDPATVNTGAADLLKAEEAYNTAINTLVQLQDQGFITRAQHDAIEPVRAHVWELLTAARDAQKAGKTIDTYTQLELFNNALKDLSKYLVRPATAPATTRSTP